MNRSFTAEVPEAVPNSKEVMSAFTKEFAANTYSVGTVWMNDEDAARLGIRNGDLVELANPLGHSTRGRVFASGGMRPGVIKLGFATGGRFSPGLGPAYKTREYTPNHNMLVDPDALSPIMGFPAYADMVVSVRKL